MSTGAPARMDSTVSIIMPAYNAGRTLAAAIDSVLNQTWPHWELLLIVDRNSSDQTHTIARAYAEKEARIRLISDLSEGGCAFNRNHGLKEASGDFIAFLDSDDLWRPNKLEKQVLFMGETGADLSCTGYKLMDWEGNELPSIICPPERAGYQQLLNDNTIGCLTVMIRRQRFPALQFVDFLHEDYILWLKLLKQTDAYGLRETLAVYRVAPTSRSGNKVRAALARWRILRDFEHLPLHRALPCYLRYVLLALRKRS